VTSYRDGLPQLGGDIFLTDGGIETTLIFHEGFELPYFAAFHLLRDNEGAGALRRYYRRYASLARGLGFGFILESATWRANTDWGARLGYSQADLDRVNREAIDLLHDLRRDLETDRSRMVISGCVGPRGDGYRPEALMTREAAQDYHAPQLRSFADAGADLATAITMTTTNEAIGIVRAAQAVRLPVVVSFTVETNGALPSGESIRQAIETVDRATGDGPAYYMINCAHPTHFAQALEDGAPWVTRIRGVRANASRCSHAELDEASTLDDGDPVEFGNQHRELRARFPHITVLGGCCGTDHRHIEAVATRVSDRQAVLG
jgi:S-methylmethionine-dependent homocysteine/selenocysteine methylase